MTSNKSTLFYALACVIIALDQVTKLAARRFLPPSRPVTVIPGFFDLRLSFNSGGAFGVLPNWAPLFIIVALVAIYAIFRLSRNGLTSKSLAVGLGLLMGGALGNLIDRLFSPNHEVTDFISLYLNIGGRVRTWPTFNVADIAIVLGAFLMLYHVYVLEKNRPGYRSTQD